MSNMNPNGKYAPIAEIPIQNRVWPTKKITKAPLWCSVDLRDGNQALVNPMGIETKLAFFDLLVKIGFKEIEVGFPAASDTEYEFIRRLIEENRIPDDVTIQVLCQAREQLVKKTIECLKGVPKAIFHIYNSTSPAQRKYTFNKSRDEIKQIAIDGVKCIKSCLSDEDRKRIRIEYSPESFSMTEIDYAIEICEAVKKEWGCSPDNKIILNLPTTVECSTPNVYADQIEYFASHITDRDSVIISTHCHNDRGTGVASAELGLLAGADRVEGCIFGNGERTGNLDVVTVALNMFSQGVDPELDLRDIVSIGEKYTEFTGMEIPPRTPYAGELVFTAFSGSHQDAIRKGMAARTKMDKDALWDVPYLLIDPHDIGRQYEGIIRINSQSGKGGAAFILEENYGLSLPKAMHPVLGAAVKEAADKAQRELKASEIYDIFEKQWLKNGSNLKIVDLSETHVEGKNESEIVETTLCRAVVSWKGKQISIGEKGNGPLDAFSSALAQTPAPRFSITAFHEHSVGTGNNTSAVAYVQITCEDGNQYWGAGKSTNVGRAGIDAVVSALNQIS
ncbi:MAG: 2-isopropylmalate synthase [Treponema sp.]|nr:2-isopropylmalate synthase [Treponema sp.]